MSKPTRPGNKEAKRSRILQFIWLLPPLSIAVAAVLVLTSAPPYNRVYVIEDASYVQQLAHQAVPESLTLLDPVWGSVIIDQPEKVLACYELLSRLPYEEADGQSLGAIRNRELAGTINFLDRANIHFSIHDSIVVDGIAYSNAAAHSEVSFLVHDLCQAFYTPEHLSLLIDRYTRIVLRTDAFRTNLSTTVKQQLKEEIQASTLLLDSDGLSAALRGRGRALCQIEIYTDDLRQGAASNEIPQVYIAVYGNGLCAVFDVDNSVGSDMHLMGNLQSILSLLDEI